jgi:parallel beta-helix repeat protein
LFSDDLFIILEGAILDALIPVKTHGKTQVAYSSNWDILFQRSSIMIKQILNALLIVSLLLAASAESAAALSSQQELAQAPSIFTPVADTYVLATSPTKNYGSRINLKADASPLENIYLKFNVQGVGVAPSAALRIYAESSNPLGLNVHTVSNTSWSESQMVWNNAPTIGAIVGSTGPMQAGNWYLVDVSSAVSGDGLVSLAITNPSSSVATITSKEGSHPPELYVPTPASPDPFVVRRDGSTYHAESQTTSSAYSGSLKFVVQSAAYELNAHGGGTITFQAGDFDLGPDWFEFYDLTGITFAGQGIDVTVLRNNASASTDTEPFDFTNGDFITIRDMTVSAGGPLRSTSDALDFDAGDNNLVERVKVTSSRGRGIVFDGKDVANGQPRTANGNVVLDCVITGIPSDGIELLASSSNRVENCQVTNVGGHGIQITKASTSASQPSKKSNDNVIVGNTIDNAGQDGINLNSGDRNLITGNTILNSSNTTTSQDGIDITSADSILCDDNIVESNTATDNQAVKTQRYGLSISSSNCHRTVVGSNNFAGNRVGNIRDIGTGTIYTTGTDNVPPSVPTGLTTTLVTQNQVDLAWNASTDNVGVTGYTIYRGGATIGTVNGTTTTFQDSTVNPNTTYSYTVQAFDAAGNKSSQSTALPVTTPAPPDSQPPSVPANLRTTNITSSFVDLAWDAAIDNVGVTGYTIYRDGNLLASVNGATTTYKDSTVAADTSYTYTVEASDAAGNHSGQSAPLPVTTLPLPQDTEPPSVPANFRTTNITYSAVDLAWDASTDNVGVTGYTIYRDSTLLGSVNSATTTYKDSTVVAGASYNYTVEAFDAASNGSGQSASLPVTIPSAPTTFTFVPVADSYVNETSPTSTYGLLTSLRADGSPLVRSYLRFNVQGIVGTVTQATLRVYANSSSSVGYSIHSVSDNSWGETTLNYTNAPAFGPAVVSSDAFTGPRWTEVNVTLLINGDGTYSLALTTPHTTAISFASREAGANAPQLVITTAP